MRSGAFTFWRNGAQELTVFRKLLGYRVIVMTLKAGQKVDQVVGVTRHKLRIGFFTSHCLEGRRKPSALAEPRC